MPGFVEIGTKPGQAAPGESSPLALLGPAGQFLGSDGANPKYEYPPGHLLAVDFGATVATALETTILSAGPIAGVFPAGVAIGDTVHIRAAGSWVNTSGGNETLTLNLYMGSTIIATATSPNEGSSATLRSWQLDAEVIYSIIGGAGVGAVRPLGSMLIATGNGTGLQNPSGNTALFYNGAVAATIATNAAAACDLRAQMSSATSSSVTCNVFRARYFPKNY